MRRNQIRTGGSVLIGIIALICAATTVHSDHGYDCLNSGSWHDGRYGCWHHCGEAHFFCSHRSAYSCGVELEEADPARGEQRGDYYWVERGRQAVAGGCPDGVTRDCMEPCTLVGGNDRTLASQFSLDRASGGGTERQPETVVDADGNATTESVAGDEPARSPGRRCERVTDDWPVTGIKHEIARGEEAACFDLAALVANERAVLSLEGTVDGDPDVCVYEEGRGRTDECHRIRHTQGLFGLHCLSSRGQCSERDRRRGNCEDGQPYRDQVRLRDVAEGLEACVHPYRSGAWTLYVLERQE